MLDFGLPLVESYLDRLSSWNQGLIAHFLEKVNQFFKVIFLTVFCFFFNVTTIDAQPYQLHSIFLQAESLL